MNTANRIVPLRTEI